MVALGGLERFAAPIRLNYHLLPRQRFSSIRIITIEAARRGRSLVQGARIRRHEARRYSLDFQAHQIGFDGWATVVRRD
jgi:hypothetical protein